MIRGLYGSAAGLLAAVRRIEVVTNNLANVQTNGYKQERTASATFKDQLVARFSGQEGWSQLGQHVLTNVAEVPAMDLSQGALQNTNRELDLALEGPGYFAVQTAEGTAYTRDGMLSRDASGALVTSTGDRVLGDNGPIQLPDGQVGFDLDGTIRVDNQAVGRLQIVDFGPDQLFQRAGNNRLIPREGGAPSVAEQTSVRQGFIEASNVDLTGAMTQSIELQRAYEANQRMIQSQDEMIGRAVNDIARPAS